MKIKLSIIIVLLLPLKLLADLTLYPLNGSKEVYISILNFDVVSSELRKEILDSRSNSIKESEKSSNYIVNDELVEKLFKSLGIKDDMTVFIYDLNTNRVKTYKLSDRVKVQAHPNDAIGDFGTIGLYFNNIPGKQEHGFAYIGYESPFLKNGTMEPVAWVKADKDSIGLKLLNDKEEYKKQNFRTYQIEKIRIDFTVNEIYIPEYKYSKDQFGLLIQMEGEKEIKITGSGEHSYIPTQIWTGKMLKNYGPVIYTNSTGMGNCGNFIFKKNKKLIRIEPPCGAWGC